MFIFNKLKFGLGKRYFPTLCSTHFHQRGQKGFFTSQPKEMSHPLPIPVEGPKEVDLIHGKRVLTDISRTPFCTEPECSVIALRLVLRWELRDVDVFQLFHEQFQGIRIVLSPESPGLRACQYSLGHQADQVCEEGRHHLKYRYPLTRAPPTTTSTDDVDLTLCFDVTSQGKSKATSYTKVAFFPPTVWGFSQYSWFTKYIISKITAPTQKVQGCRPHGLWRGLCPAWSGWLIRSNCQ